jgi:dCTP deaminase
LEYIKVPDDVLVIVLGKSTLARCGCNTLCTPLEPGWEGHITMEFANTTPLPMKFYANEGCAQLIFLRGSRPDMTYRDRGGKYQNQRGITLPKT